MRVGAALTWLLLLANLAVAAPTPGPPAGWQKLGSDPGSYDVGTDSSVVHDGHHSGWIKSG